MISPGVYFCNQMTFLIPFCISTKYITFESNITKVSETFEDVKISCDEFILYLPDLYGKNRFFEIPSDEIEIFLDLCLNVEILLRYFKPFWLVKDYRDRFNLREFISLEIDDKTIDCFTIIMRDYLASFYKNLENLCFDYIEVNNNMFQEIYEPLELCVAA